MRLLLLNVNRNVRLRRQLRRKLKFRRRMESPPAIGGQFQNLRMILHQRRMMTDTNVVEVFANCR